MAGYIASRSVLPPRIRVMDDGILAYGNDEDYQSTPITEGNGIWLETAGSTIHGLNIVGISNRGDAAIADRVDVGWDAQIYPTFVVFDGETVTVNGRTWLVLQQQGAVSIIGVGEGDVGAPVTAPLRFATGLGTTLAGTNRIGVNSAYSLTLFQAAFNYTLGWDNPAAARTLTVPDPGGNATFMFIDQSQTVSVAHDFTGAPTFTRAGIGTTPTDGLVVRNTTAAAVGAQQISPAIHWSGRGWKTDAVAASQDVDARTYLVPVEGAANPTSYITWEFSINGSAYSEVMRLTSAGVSILGTGEGGITATSGDTFRAPNVTTGGVGNIAGADLTIAAGLGTGTGDVGTIIFQLPIVAAAGDFIQTLVTALTLDMTTSGTDLNITSDAITINLFNGAMTTLNLGDGATVISIGPAFGDSTTTFNSGTASISSATGAVVVIGGVGIGGDVTAAGTISAEQGLVAGAVGVVTGAILLSGVTSGDVVITVADAAGTWTMTLPTTGGGAGEFLQTDGAGVTSWQPVVSGGGWTDDGTVVRLTTATDNVGIGNVSPTGLLDVNNTTTKTIAAGANARVLNVQGAFTEAGSGVHARIVGVEITPPTITVGVATVTNTASLYISGAPTATVTGANYAFWVDAGTSRFDGTILGVTGAGYILSSGAMAFQEATTISTTATTLTLSPATTLQITPGTFATNITGAAGTTNQTLTITNTSNVSASHAIIDIAVGGTASGDPQLRLTVPGGTSHYIAIDNSDSDKLMFGRDIVVGTTVSMTITASGDIGIGTTVPQSKLDIRGAANTGGILTLSTSDADVLSGDKLGQVNFLAPDEPNAGDSNLIAASIWAEATATFTAVSNAAALVFATALSETAAEKMRLTGAGNLSLSSSTFGTGATFNIVLGGGATSPVIGAATADLVHLAGVDIAAGDRRAAFQSETGNVIYLGNDRLRFSAATGILGIGATDVLSLTTAGIALGALNLTMTGTIAATGSRVTNIFTTNQTTTNAETVDSWGATKQHIVDYQDALQVVKGIRVVSYEHQLVFDPTGRRKLGVLAESVREVLVTPMDNYVGLGQGPRLDMLGLAALNTRAIQQMDDEVTNIRAQMAGLQARLEQLEGAQA